MSPREPMDPRRAPVPTPDPYDTSAALVPWDPRLAAAETDDEVDLRALWDTVVRYRWTILTVATVVVASTLVASLLVRPIHRATALVEIHPRGQQTVRIGDLNMPLPSARREYLQTQFRILSSESVVDAVVSRLDLGSNEEFTGESSQRGWLNGLEGLWRALGLGDPEDWEVHGKAWAVRRSFQERLSIEPVRETDLVAVRFDSFSPELAQRAANAVVEEYVRLSDAQRFDSVSRAKQFLEDQLALAEQRLERSERDLNDFSRQHDIVDVDDRSGLLTNRVSKLSDELTTSIHDRIAAESLRLQVEDGHTEDLPPILESELVAKLKEEYARLSAEHRRLAQVYRPGYPRLRQLRAQITQVRDSQERETARILAGIEASHDKALRREFLLRQQLVEEKRGLLDLRDRSVEFHILKREWETNRELHAGLLEQMRRVGVAVGMGANRASIIDPARAPMEAHHPRPLQYAVVALLLGLLLGTGLAFLLAHLDDVVRTPAELESAAGLVSLGVLPQMDASTLDSSERLESVCRTRGGSPIAQALRSLRTNLILGSRTETARILQFTSAGAGEGKTTTASNFAVVLAQRGSRVLLVDADLRLPRIHEVFDVPPAPGLAEVIVGDACVTPHESMVANLFVLPAGAATPDPGDLLGSANMDVLLEQMREEFDYVVIDSPPVLGLADSTLVGAKVDAVVLVVSAETARREAVREAVRRLRLVRSPLVGGVLNRSDQRSDRYGYYGAYHYETADGDAGSLSALG